MAGTGREEIEDESEEGLRKQKGEEKGEKTYKSST